MLNRCNNLLAGTLLTWKAGTVQGWQGEGWVAALLPRWKSHKVKMQNMITVLLGPCVRALLILLSQGSLESPNSV